MCVYKVPQELFKLTIHIAFGGSPELSPNEK